MTSGRGVWSGPASRSLSILRTARSLSASEPFTSARNFLPSVSVQVTCQKHEHQRRRERKHKHQREHEDEQRRASEEDGAPDREPEADAWQRQRRDVDSLPTFNKQCRF